MAHPLNITRRRTLGHTRSKPKQELPRTEPLEDTDAPIREIAPLFRHACNLMWKGTKNEDGCIATTEELIKLLGSSADVATVTTKRVRKLFLYYRDERRHLLSTINRKMSCLSKLMRFAYDEHLVEHMPVITFSKEPVGRVRYLTEFEEELLFSKLTPPHRALAQFLLYTGCRMGEAMNLRWSDIQEDRVTFTHTKSGKPRTIPLVAKAREAVQFAKNLRRHAPFRSAYNTFHNHWRDARRQAGMTDDPMVVPHILRHTCASRLIQGGVDIVRVKEWLGHSSVSLTMKYAHLAPHDLFKAARALGDQ